MVLRQFRVLLWRCFLIKKRQPLLTTIEIVLPIFMAAFIAIINHFDTQGNRGSFKLIPEEKYNPTVIFPDFDDIDEDRKLFSQIYYTPVTNLTTNIMDTVVRLAGEQFVLEKIGVFDGRNFSEIMKTESANPVTSVVGGVVFDVDLNMDKAPVYFNYSLIMTKFDQVNALFPNKMSAAPFYKDDKKNAYFLSNFIHIQCLINEAYLEILSNGQRPVRPRILINKYPYPKYIDSPHIYSLKTFISRSNVIGFIAIIPIILKVICGEKERRIKEMMKLMGMNDFHYYGSIFLSHFVIALFAGAVITALYFISHSGKPLLQYASITLVYFTLVLYVVCLLLFCITASTLFNKPVGATVFTLILYISSFELPHNLMKKPGLSRSEGFQVPERAHLWTCLLPTVGMDWAFTIIVELEVYLEGAHWNSLFSEIPSFELITLGNVYIMMLLSCVIMFLVIWYLDAAWPWQYGVSQPFYFPLTTSYWFGHAKSSSIPGTPATVEKSFFEGEPIGKPVICAVHLGKSFGLPFFTKVAVKDVTLNIYSGQITVLLGHNGAGKTTTMGMLTGIIPPSSGTVTIDGFDVVTQTKEARRKIGLCPQHNVLYDELTVEEHLILYGVLKGIDEIILSNEIQNVMSKLDFKRKMYTLSSELSGGMKRKLSLAIAMIGSPKVLILDEPTAGMDPEARRAVWELLFGVRRQIAVLVSTHHMEEADVLGDRIAIMADGVVKCAGTSMFLKNRFGAGYHLVFAKADNFDYQKFKHLVWSRLPEALQGSETNTEITITIDPKYTKKLAHFFEVFELSKTTIGVASCGVTVTTMEDVFLQVGSTFKNLKGFSTPNINEYAMFLKKPQKRLTKKRPQPKVTGFELLTQQFVGLILKRLNFARRYIPTIANTIVVPAMVILILLELQRQTLNALENPWFSIALELNKLYKNTEAFVYQKPANFSSIAFQQLVSAEYEQEMSEEGVNLIPITINPNNYLLGKAKNESNKYQKKHIISASFREIANGTYPLSATAWYNGEALQSMPISINMIYRAMQRQIVRNIFDKEVGTIHVINLPFPKKLFYRQWFVFPNIGRYLYLSFIPLSMSFIASGFILIPIHERISKAKLVQLMTGVNKFLFWLCHFIFDFSTHILACVVILIIFWIWDTSNIYFSSLEYSFGLFLMFLLFGFTMIPCVYLLSFYIHSQATGFAAVMMIVLLFGLILGYIIFVFQLLMEKETLSKSQFNVIYSFALIFPPFALTWGVQKLFYNGAASLLCQKVPENQREAMCSLDPLYLKSMNLVGCCPELCGEACFNKTVCFHWFEFGINSEIFALIILAVIFWFLLLVIESKLYYTGKALIEKNAVGAKLCSFCDNDAEFLKARSKSSEKDDDEDVANERKKVEQLVKQKKINSEAIVIHNLTKRFKTLTAVDDISLAIHKEEFFGFLGINGAGKTTTFSMLTGDLQPTFGNAYIDDINCNLTEQTKQYGQQIGYCPQFDPLLDKLTGREMLILIARLRGIRGSSLTTEVNNLLKLVDLEAHADKQTINYSGGNKRKLSLALAIVGSPKVVFLDEPTAGVDAESRRKMWSTLIDLQALTGCAIVLTSHTIDECEALCNRLTIMVNGKFRCLGSTQHLRSKFGQGFTIVIKLKRDMFLTPSTKASKITEKSQKSISPAKEIENKTEKIKYVKQYMFKAFPHSILKDEHDVMIHFHVVDNKLSWAYLFRTMEKAKIDLNLEDYQIGDTTLEQIFLAFARKQRKKETR